MKAMKGSHITISVFVLLGTGALLAVGVCYLLPTDLCRAAGSGISYTEARGQTS